MVVARKPFSRADRIGFVLAIERRHLVFTVVALELVAIGAFYGTAARRRHPWSWPNR